MFHQHNRVSNNNTCKHIISQNMYVLLCLQSGSDSRLCSKPEHHISDQEHQTSRQHQHKRPEIFCQLHTSGKLLTDGMVKVVQFVNNAKSITLLLLAEKLIIRLAKKLKSVDSVGADSMTNIDIFSNIKFKSVCLYTFFFCFIF